MADKNAKHQKNAKGKFYVDNNCIGCGQCRDLAPDFFIEDPDNGMIYVGKQPTSEGDIKLCQEALQNCPVEAIGEDGE
jgi:ferredoxin